MKLSIIVPVLNEAKTLATFLGHLQLLSDGDHELIVVDGGSEDQSVAIAVPICHQIIHSTAGRARQMNAGAEQASGDYLLFLHADTWLPEPFCDWISMISNSHEMWGHFDVALNSQQWPFRIIETCMNWRSRLTDIATGDQALFVRRDQFSMMGGFADILLMEDIELCRRLRRVSVPLRVDMPVRTSSRRWERGGVFRTICFMWALRARYFFGAEPAQLAKSYYQHVAGKVSE